VLLLANKQANITELTLSENLLEMHLKRLYLQWILIILLVKYTLVSLSGAGIVKQRMDKK
jgi:hypothetical protein